MSHRDNEPRPVSDAGEFIIWALLLVIGLPLVLTAIAAAIGT